MNVRKSGFSLGAHHGFGQHTKRGGSTRAAIRRAWTHLLFLLPAGCRLGYRKYGDRYLGAFAYRFNRRFDLTDLVVRLVVDVSRGMTTPERVIRHA